MKTLFRNPTIFASRSTVAAIAIVSLGLAARGIAAADDSAQAQAGTVVTTTSPVSTPAHKGSSHRVSTKAATSAESVETRIAYLHSKFAITAAQEETWNKVAALMRENADKMTALVKSRADQAKTMTAVDDLKSYAEISGAHEDGTKKLIPAFTTLYESMSAAQKSVADAEFRGHGRHAGAHGHAIS